MARVHQPTRHPHVIPKPESKHAAESAGAYVSCWINFKSHRGARKLAEVAIEDEGWIIRRLDEEFETGREFYKGDDENLRYVQEAEEDGWCFFYDSYARDAPDKDDDDLDG